MSVTVRFGLDFFKSIGIDSSLYVVAYVGGCAQRQTTNSSDFDGETFVLFSITKETKFNFELFLNGECISSLALSYNELMLAKALNFFANDVMIASFEIILVRKLDRAEIQQHNHNFLHVFSEWFWMFYTCAVFLTLLSRFVEYNYFLNETYGKIMVLKGTSLLHEHSTSSCVGISSELCRVAELRLNGTLSLLLPSRLTPLDNGQAQLLLKHQKNFAPGEEMIWQSPLPPKSWRSFSLFGPREFRLVVSGDRNLSIVDSAKQVSDRPHGAIALFLLQVVWNEDISELEPLCNYIEIR